jgi:hypothetical protein
MTLKIAIDINDVIRDNIYQFRHIYQKYIDNDFEINLDEIDSFNMMEVYPFVSENDLNKFKYEDYSYELYGRAECCDKILPYIFNDWIEKVLNNLDEEYIPEVIFFSPFEMGITIQATYSFLSAKGFRVRGVIFPKDSSKIFDMADIVITAQPSLLENCPENKYIIKVNKPYNKDCECKYSFNSMLEIIQDEDNTITNILTNNERN